MRSLTHQRCFNHAGREAAARCPECGRFFCRECVTEHDERVICAACVKKLAGVSFTQRGAFVGVVRVLQLTVSLLFVWACFHLMGRALLAVPGKFHDGTVWKRSWVESE